MSYHKLIFSSNRYYRLRRHLLFWLAVFLYHFVRISFLYPTQHFWENALSILSGAIIWGVLFNMAISYSIVYYLIPKFYNNKKYVAFVLSLLLLFIIMSVLNTLYIFYSKLNWKMAQAIYASSMNIMLFLKANFIRLLGNPPLICATLLSLRTMKNWYLKQQENIILARENTNAELQLLKAQIHPHFLFNTLNNIYSFTLAQSPYASELVEKLTDTLHYMITDCDVPLVALEKELKMIGDYMDLEKVRYGNQLKLQMNITGDYRDKLIAPLLLIPFVENSFKHGTSKILDDPWIDLSIRIDENILYFELKNNKPMQTPIYGKKGIGLNNVQKRLELIYPGNHLFEIKQMTSSFEVKLCVPLQANPVKEKFSFNAISRSLT